MFVCVSFVAYYAFLNRSSDCDEVWFRDRLDLWKKDRLI